MENTSRSKRRDALIPLLKDASPEVRQAAAQALETLEAAQSLEEVFDSLKRGDRGTKIRAIYALGRIGGEQVIPILLYCAGRSEEDIRCAAIKVLGETARPEARATLLEKLQDPSQAVRAVAIEALSHYGDRSLVPNIMPFLEEDDGMLDAEAALALGRIGDAARVESLIIKLLDSQHEKTRAAAATALSLLPLNRP
jgi:HEAT repeat protein